MSLLKCKFIIGVSCAVTLLTSYLIVSEQRRDIHLANPFLESFSTRCTWCFEGVLQSWLGGTEVVIFILQWVLPMVAAPQTKAKLNLPFASHGEGLCGYRPQKVCCRTGRGSTGCEDDGQLLLFRAQVKEERILWILLP